MWLLVRDENRSSFILNENSIKKITKPYLMGINEYGDKGCDKYNESSDNETVILFDTSKIKDFGFDSFSPTLTNYMVSGEDWLDINDNVIIEWAGSDTNSGIVSAEVKYCYWENWWTLPTVHRANQISKKRGVCGVG